MSTLEALLATLRARSAPSMLQQRLYQQQPQLSLQQLFELQQVDPSLSLHQASGCHTPTPPYTPTATFLIQTPSYRMNDRSITMSHRML